MLTRRGLLSLATLSMARAASLPSGPQVLTFRSSIDASDQPYGLYVPKQQPEGPYPLVIMLHGAGSNHRLALRRVLGKGNRPGESDLEASRHFPELPDVEFLVATPLARGTMGYQGIPEQDVYDVLAEVKRQFPVDPNRTYLTGLSMGGGGALWLGLTRPDQWAAVAAVCPAAPDGITALMGNAENYLVHLYQGELDPLVPAQRTRDLHRRFFDLGIKAEYTEYPHIRHNSWDVAYRNATIFDVFRPLRRNAFPARVRFASDQYRYQDAYWVRFDKLIPGSLASIDARFSAPGKLNVETRSLDAFTLKLQGHPMAKVPVLAAVDGRPFRLRPNGSTSFTRTATGWTLRRSQPSPSGKRAGREGPVADAVSRRHIYVYGTKDNPGADEILRRKRIAEQASDWSTPQYHLQLTLAVLADVEVSDAALRESDVVLFGSRESNTLIDRFAAQLPMHLNASAADYGLLYVAPLAERLALVSSGLPWFTPSEAAKRGLSFVPEQLRLLQALPDYVVFSGSLDHVLASGYFDNEWKLRPEDSAKLGAIGALRSVAR